MAERPFLRRPHLSTSTPYRAASERRPLPTAAFIALLSLAGCAVPSGEADVGSSRAALDDAPVFDGICETSENYAHHAYGEASSQTGIVYGATCNTATAPGNIVRLDLRQGASTTIIGYDADRTVSFLHTGPDFAAWRASKVVKTGSNTVVESALVFYDANRGAPKSVDAKILIPGVSSAPSIRFAAYAGGGRALVAWDSGYQAVQVGVL